MEEIKMEKKCAMCGEPIPEEKHICENCEKDIKVKSISRMKECRHMLMNGVCVKCGLRVVSDYRLC